MRTGIFPSRAGHKIKLHRPIRATDRGHSGNLLRRLLDSGVDRNLSSVANRAHQLSAQRTVNNNDNRSERRLRQKWPKRIDRRDEFTSFVCHQLIRYYYTLLLLNVIEYRRQAWKGHPLLHFGSRTNRECTFACVYEITNIIPTSGSLQVRLGDRVDEPTSLLDRVFRSPRTFSRHCSLITSLPRPYSCLLSDRPRS